MGVPAHSGCLPRSAGKEDLGADRRGSARALPDPSRRAAASASPPPLVQRRENAASTIQAAWRGARGRRLYATAQRQMMQQRMEDAATRLQQAWIRRKERRMFVAVRAATERESKRKHASAVAIQRVYRGVRGRRAAERQRQLKLVVRAASTLGTWGGPAVTRLSSSVSVGRARTWRRVTSRPTPPVNLFSECGAACWAGGAPWRAHRPWPPSGASLRTSPLVR